MTTADTVVIPKGADAAAWAAAIAVIRRFMPPHEGRSLHRDFQPRNVLFDVPPSQPAGARITGVVDWAATSWGGGSRCGALLRQSRAAARPCVGPAVRRGVPGGRRAAGRDRERAAVLAGQGGAGVLGGFEGEDGREPLCRFPGVPIPDMPFPQANEVISAEWFRQPGFPRHEWRNSGLIRRDRRNAGSDFTACRSRSATQTMKRNTPSCSTATTPYCPNSIQAQTSWSSRPSGRTLQRSPLSCGRTIRGHAHGTALANPHRRTPRRSRIPHLHAALRRETTVEARCHRRRAPSGHGRRDQQRAPRPRESPLALPPLRRRHRCDPATPAERDALRDRHRSWLTTHPRGL